MKKNITALLLCAIMLSCFASCGNSDGSPSVTDAAETSAQTTEETTEAGPALELPADLDFGGEAVNIWYFTKNSDVSETFIDIAGELNGDVVDESLYYRNIKVEEALNIDLVFTDTGIGSSDVGAEIRKLIMSGSTDYDVYNVVQWNTAKYVTEGLFLNIIDAPYIDIGKPWWSSYYINEINIGDKNRYFLCGDISIDTVRCISCMYYNKSIYENYYGDADGLYTTVLDGKWTIDRLAEYTEAVYSDLNGDDIANDGDRFGLMLNNYNNIDVLFFGADNRITGHDSDGMPYLTVNNERTSAFMQKLYSLCYENMGTMMRKEGAGTLENTKGFNDGYSLFLTGFLYSSELLRDMPDDYGIIPPPKYDETQENYRAVVHDIATLICLPTTCQKLDTVSAALEMMAYESYKSVTPAYYETAMKTKYTRDEISSRIIDLIHDSNMTDMAYSYGDNFNGLGLTARTMIASKKSDLASFYATKEKSALVKIGELIDKYTGLN